MTLEAYPPPVSSSYGTTAPSSPGDGQEWILPVGTLPNIINWRFRYVAAITDGYPWVYQGGAPLYSYAGGFAMPAAYGANVPQDDSAAPQFTIPRSGIYVALNSGVVYPPATPGAIVQMSSTIYRYPNGATPAVQLTVDGRVEWSANAAMQWMLMPFFRRAPITLAANDLLKARYMGSVANTAATFDDRYLEVTPVRVG